MDRFIVVFGGFRFYKSKVPQPFTSTARHEDVEYLSDIYIYDTQNLSWHNPTPEGPTPPGRYGHAAAPLDNRRMVVFGGRGQGGRFLQDTWVFDISLGEWSGPLFGDEITPCPSPRCFCACIAGFSSEPMVNNTGIFSPNKSTSSGSTNGGSSTSKVFLFGGTGGIENFGDLWILKVPHKYAAVEDMRWERAVAVGPTPSPRYGHRMVSIGQDLVVVMGGCAVTPQSEIANFDSGDLRDTHYLFTASDALMEAYKAEGDVPVISGKALWKSAHMHNHGHEQLGMKELLRQASTTAGVVQQLEAETRRHEETLVDRYYKSEAKKRFSLAKAKHPFPQLDITFLNTRDLTWSKSSLGGTVDKAKGAGGGGPPTSRMHFSACFVGHYILVIGGSQPTSLGFSPVDPDYSRLYALDTYTLRWIEPRPVETAGYFDEPIRIAEADVIRAKRRCEEEKLR